MGPDLFYLTLPLQPDFLSACWSRSQQLRPTIASDHVIEYITAYIVLTMRCRAMTAYVSWYQPGTQAVIR
jgi:hypothetical protein